MWRWRASLAANIFFGKDKSARGQEWWEYGFIDPRRAAPEQLAIAFAFVATHNHFVLDRGGKVFKQSAPVIKLPDGASEDDHLALLGVLNSSTACFWLQQVSHNKGAGGGARVDAGYSAMGEEPWMSTFEFTGTKLAGFPLPESRPLALSKRLDAIAGERSALLHDPGRLLDDRSDLIAAAERDLELRELGVFLQEELDWQVLADFGLTSEPLTWPGEDVRLAAGERAFEIGWARDLAAGEGTTKWFDKFSATFSTQAPATWPAGYRDLVEARIALIEEDRDLRLIESPECKRRWEELPWAKREQNALRSWLLDQIEALPIWDRGDLVTSAQLADAVTGNARVLLAAQRLAGSLDVDLGRTIEKLVLTEAVPYLAAHRYKESGLRSRAEWEQVWEQQREEDAIDALGLPADAAEQRKRTEVGEIPIPPKYKPADFRKTDYWRLRGKLDVPKERFVLVPEGSRTGDPSPVVGWAGWDHATLAFALAGRASLLRSQDGAGEERLIPLLAGILGLLPWVAQWHPEPDAETGEPPAHELEDFLADELGALGRTRDDLRAWRPPAGRGRRPRAAV